MKYPQTIAVRIVDEGKASEFLDAKDRQHVADLLDKVDKAEVAIYRFDHLAIVESTVTTTKKTRGKRV